MPIISGKLEFFMATENEKSKKSLVKSGFVLSLMTFASRIMGLIREMTKASFLGTGMYADAFSTAFMLPNLFRRLFAENAVSVAFIPTFKSYTSKGDSAEAKKETQDFLNATFTLVTFLTTCVVLICIIAAPLISMIFCKKPVDPNNIGWTVQARIWLSQHIPFIKAPFIPSELDYNQLLQNFSLNKSEITILTRIMFPYLIVISIAALFQGILNGCKIFAPSGFTPVLFNGAVVLGTYLLAPHTENPARAMAYGTIAGGCIQALFQFPFLRKTGWKVCFTSLKKTFTNPGTKKVIALIGPTIVGMAAYQLNDLVSTSMASRAGEGIVSSLSYSLRLQELILGIFAVSIGTVILPDLSGLAAQKKWEDFNKMLVQAIRIIIVITIPVTFYSLICGKELISLVYMNKKFDVQSVKLTLGAFRFHIAGLFFIAVNRIIAPAFYAQENSKLPTLAGILSFLSNILLVMILVGPMSGNGIALALNLASGVNTLFLIKKKKKMNSFDVKKILKESFIYIIKILIFSVIASIPTYFFRNFIVDAFADYGRLISQGIPVILSAILFFIIGAGQLIITKDQIVMVILRKFRRN